jgi:outer membrane protein assembly factor BamA
MVLRTVAGITYILSSVPPSSVRRADTRSNRRWSCWWLYLACALLTVPATAQDASEAPDGQPETPVSIIQAIEFTGNKVTRPQTMLQEMLVKVGDVADPSRIERSRQAIMDLGLFVSVTATLEPLETGVLLRITVKEKYYILPVPKLNRDDDNNFNLGAELTLDNLAGLNQTLKLRYESEDAAGLSDGEVETTTLSYTYPRVLGSPYLISTDLSLTRTPYETVTDGVLDALYELQSRSASLMVSRWLAPEGPSRGWQVGGGLVWRRNNYEFQSGTPSSTLQDSQAVGISVLGQYVNVHDYLYSRSGEQFGYTGEYGAPPLGSDTQYTRHAFFYRKYILLEGVPHQNIDLQALLSLSSGDIFPGDSYAYSIGGSRTLRGFATGSFLGNAYVLFNVQYLRPVFGYNPLRSVVFLDIGNAYPSNEQIDLGDLKWSAGVGLRLRLKSFVKIDLRLDVAYVYETGDYKVFAGTKEAF